MVEMEQNTIEIGQSGVNVIHQSQILPNTIKEEHLESNVHAIKFGLAANRPSGSTHTKCYFATDTNDLSIWNGSNWVAVTLS